MSPWHTAIAKAGVDDMPFIGVVGRALQILFVARKGTSEVSSTSRQAGPRCLSAPSYDKDSEAMTKFLQLS